MIEGELTHSWSYDENKNHVIYTRPDGEQIRYEYNNDNLLTKSD